MKSILRMPATLKLFIRRRGMSWSQLQREAKRKIPSLILFTKDIQNLHLYLNLEQDKWQNLLPESPLTKIWKELAKKSNSVHLVQPPQGWTGCIYFSVHSDWETLLFHMMIWSGYFLNWKKNSADSSFGQLSDTDTLFFFTSYILLNSFCGL